ncbi:helix-turn-helix domain-containing protein [Paenibacillus sp. Soil787]|uniref:helix-turn-helix domain-containing protein n=1 Tax=Paenibacillus sp. Soil787 TaxID=1736411 RepID=UPI0007029072|nr:helix-turn-helix domain-containing protein [Paenibacillus sp. Soil787]KRF21501.1 hypothetical protein ASG93_09020 [Paenibacillus sp. Soil787]
MKAAHRKGNRLFRRLLVFNLLTVVLITIVPQYIFYHYFKSMYEEEINVLNMQTVRQFQSAIDEPIIKSVTNFPNQYLSEVDSNETLTTPFFTDIRNDNSTIRKVSRQIGDIKNNLPYIHSINIYYRQSNILFMDNYACMLEVSDCVQGSRQDWFSKFKDSDINIMWVPARLEGPFDSNLVVSYVRSIPFFGSKDQRQGTLAVNINVSYLESMLRKLKTSSEGRLLILDEHGRLIARNQPDSSKAIGEEQPFSQKMLSMGATGIFSDKIEGQTSVVSYIQSEYNNWRYVSITSVENFYQKSTRLRVWMSAVGAAFLSLNIMISVFLTKQASKPISRRMDSMQLSLEKYQPIIMHRFILNLLKGAVPQNATLQDIGVPAGMRLDSAYICCFVLHIYGKSQRRMDEETAVIIRVVEALEDKSALGAICAVQDEGFEISGIVNIDHADNLPDMIRLMTARLDGVLQERYVLCIGQVYPVGITEIGNSYAEAKLSVPYAFLRSESNVIQYEDLHLSELKDNGSSAKIIVDIEPCIRQGNEKRLQLLIGYVLSELRTSEYTLVYCRNTLLDVVSAIRRAVKNMGYSSSEMLGGDIREHFKAVETIDEFENWIYLIIQIVMDKINDRKNHVNQEFSAQIIKFIEDNIYNQLSLDMVAEYANINPTYLSKIFKMITGSNFSDYVTVKKLEQAVILLREEELSIQEISNKVGYNSTHHFIRLFKEKYGQTPKRYQKSLRNEENS